MKSFLLRLTLFLLLTLVVVEAVFRWVIPASDQPFYAQHPRHKIRMFDTSGVRDGLFTEGRFAEFRIPWHVNNAGWNAGIEYLPRDKRSKPLIAVVGDSYVEGFYVAWEDHLAARLARELRDEVAVYSFGVSGISFAQYILVSRYLADEFQPDVIVISIGSGRLRSSLAALAPSAYNLQYKETPEGGYQERMPDPVHLGLGRHLRKSAFVRYLIKNAGLTLGLAAADAEPVLQKRRAVRDLYRQQRERLKKVTRHVLRQLYAEHPDTRFVFLVDGPRQELLDGELDPPSVPDAVLLEELTAELGGQVVDLRERFNAEYRRDRRSFSFPNNYHWDAYGNQVVASELARHLRAGESGQGPATGQGDVR